MPAPHLLVAISAHGLGHLGQAAPVCNALRHLCPGLKLTLWSAIPKGMLERRIRAPFAHIERPCDIGFVMYDALRVNIAASWQAYSDREVDWGAQLEDACTHVKSCTPDLIISDIGDMPLAAGQRMGIPTIAMSSLNWADMARHYFSDLPQSKDILSRLDAIYAQSTLALRLTPGMSMHGLREIIVPPVGTISAHSRATLQACLLKHLPYPDKPCLLIGMGGIDTPLGFACWPAQSDINLIMANQPTLPPDGDVARGLVNADNLRTRYGLSFPDLLAACDAVLCKPGYGSFVEAVLAGRPVLYVCRHDWPEQRVLLDWLRQNARSREFALHDLAAGRFKLALDAVLTLAPPPAIRQDGATVAAREILALMN